MQIVIANTFRINKKYYYSQRFNTNSEANFLFPLIKMLPQCIQEMLVTQCIQEMLVTMKRKFFELHTLSFQI